MKLMYVATSLIMLSLFGNGSSYAQPDNIDDHSTQAQAQAATPTTPEGPPPERGGGRKGTK